MREVRISHWCLLAVEASTLKQQRSIWGPRGLIQEQGTTTFSVAGNQWGNTSINRTGTLKLNVDDAIPATTLITMGTNNDSVYNASASLDLNGFDQTIGGITTVGSILGAATPVGSRTVSGPGELTINDNGSREFDGNFTGALDLVKTGTGTLELSGNTSDYTGSTTINAGILELSADNAAGATSSILINDPGTLQLNSVTLDRSITANSGGDPSTNSAAIHVVGGGVNEISGAITLLNSTGIKSRLDANTSLEISGGVTGNFSLFLYDDSSGAPGITVTTNPINIGTNLLAGHGLTIDVAGNTAGTLRADWGQQITLGVDNAFTTPVAVIVANSSNASGLLDLAGYDLEATSITAGQSSANAIITSSSGTPTLTVTNAVANTYEGVITGSISLEKGGAGTLTLTRNSSYSGTTAVNAGSLRVNGDLSGASGAVTVASGASLEGIGTLGSAITIESGGNLQPGVGSEGTLIIDSDLNLAGVYDFDISGTTVSTHDLTSVTGNVTLSGTLNVVEAGGTDFSSLTVGDEIRLIDLTGAGSVSGTFADLAEGGAVTLGGSVFTISYTGGNGNDVVLTFVGETETSVTTSGTALILTDADAGDTDDELTVTLSATGYTITDTTGSKPIGVGIAGAVQNNAYEVFIPFTSLAGITDFNINTLDGVDVVTIDFAGLNGTALQQKIIFAGGAGNGDALVFENGAFTRVVHNMINGSSGTFDLDNDNNTDIEVEYSGLEPVDMSGSTATDFIFNLPAGADNAQLSESGGFLTLESTDGVPTFESTTFAAPSGSITINGQVGDVLTVSNAINLSASNTDLILNVPSIDLRGNINSGSGDQTFAGDLTLENSTGNLELTAGNVNFNGDTTLKNSDSHALFLRVSGAATNTAGNHFDLNDGRMQLRGGTEFINNGSFEIGGNASAPIWADSQTDFDNKITNNGAFLVNSLQFRLYVTLTNTATGILTINNPSGADAAEIQMKAPQGIGTGGEIVNQGVLNISGTSTIFNDSGSIENASGGIVNVTSNVEFKDSTSLVNQSGGTANLNSGDITFDQTTATNASGGILNLVDGSLSMINGGSVTSAGTTNLVDTNYTIGGTGTFTNDGTLDLTPTSADRDLILNATLQNNGTTNYTLASDHFGLSGSGSFENAGTFEHIKGSGTDNFHLDDFTFNNLAGGVYRFHGGGDIEISGNGVFNNAGTLERTATAANDSVIFDFGTGANGSFNNLAGGIVQSLGGILHIAAQKGNTSDAASQWIANGGDLRIGGTWEGAINGSSSTANGGRVEITNQSNGEFFENVTVGPAGLSVNISDAGFLWDDSNIDTQGNAFTNEGIMTISGTAAKTLDGTLTNNGTLNIEGSVTVTDGDIINASGGALTWQNGAVTLTNAGDEIVNESGGTLNIIAGGTKTLTGGEIRNESGGSSRFPEWHGHVDCCDGRDS